MESQDIECWQLRGNCGRDPESTVLDSCELAYLGNDKGHTSLFTSKLRNVKAPTVVMDSLAMLMHQARPRRRPRHACR